MFIRNQAFDVFRPVFCPIFRTASFQKIDTVFYTEHPPITPEDVRKQLVEHDHYPHDIVVRKTQNMVS